MVPTKEIVIIILLEMAIGIGATEEEKAERVRIPPLPCRPNS